MWISEQLSPIGVVSAGVVGAVEEGVGVEVVVVAGPAHGLVLLPTLVAVTWWPGAGGEVRVGGSADTAGAPGPG